MVIGLTIFVEGDPRLREGFDYLFGTYMSNNKPFRMSKGKQDSLNKLKADLGNTLHNALIDLDRRETEREQDLIDNGVYTVRERVYYMVQEMEGWFLSQPEILDNHFNLRLSTLVNEKYQGVHAKEISNPAGKLDEFIKAAVSTNAVIDQNKKTRTNYDKVSDAIKLLKKLDLQRLKQDFTDVNSLTEILN